MLNQKRKKVRIHNCCLFTWYDLVQLSHTLYAIRCCNIMEPKSIARLSGDGRQDMENNRNRLTHNSINKSVIYVKIEL